MKHFDVFLCTNCFQKRRRRSQIETISIILLVAAAAAALWAYSTKSSNRRSASDSRASSAHQIDERSHPPEQVFSERSPRQNAEPLAAPEPLPLNPTEQASLKEETAIPASSPDPTDEYPDECLIIIRGQQKGGRRCQADSNGRTTFYLFNEAGYVQYFPEDETRKVWSAFWHPKNGADEELGSLMASGKCIKNDVATIC